MSARQALIVDDSRSARLILGRMLEGFGLQVTAVESAEDALSWLQGTRPDVIFMDHLMPGMDGFAAVRLIKANPKTATIPVLMYTSQEGEMYLSQARALGVVGVVPKTLKPNDVATVLQQLNLQSETPPPRTVDPVPPRPPAAASAVEVVRVATDDHPVDAPASPVANERLAHRIAAEIRAELAAFAAQPPKATRSTRILTAMLIVVLLIAASALYQTARLRNEMDALQASQQQMLTLLNRRTPAPSLPAPMAAAPASLPIEEPVLAPQRPSTSPVAPRVDSEPYLYGEVPFAGPRVEHLRRLLDSLRADNFRGTVRVAAYSADFCLSGSNAEGYQPAMDEVLARRCDLTGNPFADGLTVQQRQSVAFANLLASTLRSQIQVEVVDAGRVPATAYPALTNMLTAGEWNRAAERNQRVEFTVLPAS